MEILEKIAEDRFRHTPATGFNLVAFRDDAPLCEMLYLVAHHETREAAEREMGRRKAEGFRDSMAIYSADDL